MLLVEEYLENQEKYSKIYGDKTIILTTKWGILRNICT